MRKILKIMVLCLCTSALGEPGFRMPWSSGDMNYYIPLIENNVSDWIETAKIKYASVIVECGTNDVQNGTALRAAYLEASALTPGGNALSRDNRAAVILPRAHYDLGDTSFVLSNDYVDIIAMYPEMGRVDWDENGLPEVNGELGETPNPPPTYLYGTAGYLVRQSASDIRLHGFGILNKSDFFSGDVTNGIPFRTDVVSNYQDSVYSMMFLHYNQQPGIVAANSMHAGNVEGTWIDCIGAERFWRVSWEPQTGAGPQSKFKARMIRCIAGEFSFGGDTKSAAIRGTASFEGAYLEDCYATFAGFGGCWQWSIHADSNTVFKNCKAGDNSFVGGATNSATMINCEGGNYCGGASPLFNGYTGNDPTQAYSGVFNGYARGCKFGAGSLGGRGGFTGTVGSPLTTTLSGTVIDCIVDDPGVYDPQHGTNPVPWLVKGATIINSTFNIASTNSLFQLEDSSSVIENCVLKVNGSHSGIPITATNAQSVIAAGCVFNNGDNDADGIGPNVTNSALTPGNAIY